MTNQELLPQLKRPFPVEEIRFRVGRVFRQNQKLYAQALPYVHWTSCVARLDEVFGWEGWTLRFHPLTREATCCRLTVRLPDGKTLEREGVGEYELEAFESSLFAPSLSRASEAFRQACAHLQIGAYLYQAPLLQGEIDPARKQFLHPEDLARALYRKAGLELPVPEPPPCPLPAPPAPAVVEVLLSGLLFEVEKASNERELSRAGQLANEARPQLTREALGILKDYYRKRFKALLGREPRRSSGPSPSKARGQASASEENPGAESGSAPADLESPYQVEDTVYSTLEEVGYLELIREIGTTEDSARLSRVEEKCKRAGEQNLLPPEQLDALVILLAIQRASSEREAKRAYSRVAVTHLDAIGGTAAQRLFHQKLQTFRAKTAPQAQKEGKGGLLDPRGLLFF